MFDLVFIRNGKLLSTRRDNTPSILFSSLVMQLMHCDDLLVLYSDNLKWQSEMLIAFEPRGYGFKTQREHIGNKKHKKNKNNFRQIT